MESLLLIAGLVVICLFSGYFRLLVSRHDHHDLLKRISSVIGNSDALIEIRSELAKRPFSAFDELQLDRCHAFGSLEYANVLVLIERLSYRRQGLFFPTRVALYCRVNANIEAFTYGKLTGYTKPRFILGGTKNKAIENLLFGLSQFSFTGVQVVEGGMLIWNFGGRAYEDTISYLNILVDCGFANTVAQQSFE